MPSGSTRDRRLALPPLPPRANVHAHAHRTRATRLRVASPPKTVMALSARDVLRLGVRLKRSALAGPSQLIASDALSTRAAPMRLRRALGSLPDLSPNPTPDPSDSSGGSGGSSRNTLLDTAVATVAGIGLIGAIQLRARCSRCEPLAGCSTTTATSGTSCTRLVGLLAIRAQPCRCALRSTLASTPSSSSPRLPATTRHRPYGPSWRTTISGASRKIWSTRSWTGGKRATSACALGRPG